MVKAYSGSILVKPLEEKSAVSLDEGQNRKILKGTIVHVGAPLETEFGKLITCPLKEGQIAYFLSYADDYDNCEIEDKLHYFVLFKDIRGYED